MGGNGLHECHSGQLFPFRRQTGLGWGGGWEEVKFIALSQSTTEKPERKLVQSTEATSHWKVSNQMGAHCTEVPRVQQSSAKRGEELGKAQRVRDRGLRCRNA